MTYLFGGRQLGFEDEGRLQLFRGSAHRLQINSALASEIVKEQPMSDSSGLGYVTDGDFVIVLFREDPDSRGDDPLTGLSRLPRSGSWLLRRRHGVPLRRRTWDHRGPVDRSHRKSMTDSQRRNPRLVTIVQAVRPS